MGFMDELKKLTQPYEEEDDFFEGADASFKPQPKAEAQTKTGSAQMVFESSFMAEDTPAPEAQTQKAAGEGSGFFSNLGLKKAQKPKAPARERMVSFGGKETQVILFSPKSFDEAGELVNYMLKNMTVVMTLESVPSDMARRLLDFLSGIAFALQGKITPVSAKTYFITPQNVDILGTEAQPQPETTSHYF